MENLVSMAYADSITLLPVHDAESMWLKVAIYWPVISRSSDARDLVAGTSWSVTVD